MAIIDGFDSTLGEIVNGRVDADSPIDESLMFDIRDQIEFIQRWLGKSFITGAVADHRHDDIDSKKILATDIVGSLVSSTAVQFSTTTGTPGFSVNIAHGLGRTPNYVWGDIKIERADNTRRFRYHWINTASEVWGRFATTEFGDIQSSLTNNGIANDSDLNVASPVAPNQTWKITVDATNIVLTCTTPDINIPKRFFFFKVA